MSNRNKRNHQYDYENTFDKPLLDLDKLFIEEMIKNKLGLHYVTKTIRSGRMFEVEIYPIFNCRRDIPKVKINNSRVQNCLNEKNSRKRFIRIANENFGEGDLWLTFTYEDSSHPKTEEEAKRNIGNYIKRVNRLRRKEGLKNARYIYIYEWEEEPEKTRCHYHVLMEGGIDRNTLEDMWKFAVINDSSRIRPNEEGIAGLASYMAEKKKKKGKRRWIPSKNLKQPKENISHTRIRSRRQVERMAKDYEEIRSFFEKEKTWKRYQFMDAEVFYNEFNNAFYIRIKARERSWESERNRKESITDSLFGNMHRNTDYGGMGGHTGAKKKGTSGNHNTGRKDCGNSTGKSKGREPSNKQD